MEFKNMIDIIQLGDCYELIKTIPDKSIDCIYVDIPYLFDEHVGGTSKLAHRIKRLNNEDLGD